jgi:hypothetical protein
MMNKQDVQLVLRRALGVSLEAMEKTELTAALRRALGNLSETHLTMRLGMAQQNRGAGISIRRS